jgi:hypothetical protein
LIKKDFSNEIKLDHASNVTGAWYAYDLRRNEIAENGPEHQKFMDSWQAQLYSTIAAGNPVLAAENADSERQTILMMATAVRWIICSRQQQLIELRVLPIAGAITVDTIAVKAVAVWLASSIPALAFVTPGVLVAFTVFLVGFGLKKFCESERLYELLRSDKLEE